MCVGNRERVYASEATVHMGGSALMFSALNYSDRTESTYPAFAHTPRISKCNSKPEVPPVARNFILCSLILIRQQMIIFIRKGFN